MQISKTQTRIKNINRKVNIYQIDNKNVDTKNINRNVNIKNLNKNVNIETSSEAAAAAAVQCGAFCLESIHHFFTKKENSLQQTFECGVFPFSKFQNPFLLSPAATS